MARTDTEVGVLIAVCLWDVDSANGYFVFIFMRSQKRCMTYMYTSDPAGYHFSLQ